MQWLVAGALLVSACTQSQVAPEAPVVIDGTVARSDGSALSGHQVALHVDPGPSILFWTPVIVGTLGAACATDLCGADHATRTDDQGRYAFDLRGSDVQGTFAEEVDLLLQVAGPAGPDDHHGPAAHVRFVVRAEQTTLPDVRLWEPTITIGDESVAWDALPADRGTATSTEVLFQRSNGAVLWEAPAAAEGLTIDPRILEDAAGGVAGVATLSPPSPEGIIGVELRSATRRFRSEAGAPRSRGAGCSVLTDDDSRTSLEPCPWTDGNLTVLAGDTRPPCPAEDPCPQVEGVEVELGGPSDVQLVVVRGCDECTIEVGEASAQLTSRFAAVPMSARGHRVRLTGDLTKLTEISVWDGPPASGLQAVSVQAPPDGAATGNEPGDAPDGGSADDAGGDRWRLVAVGLLGLTVGATGAAALLLRRRRTGDAP